MDINATGAQSWPLASGSNDNPSLTQGVATTFALNTVPDRCPGGLAYYLPFVDVTFTGNVVQSGTGGTAIAYDVLRQCVLESIDWGSAWHGTVLSGNHVKGSFLPIVEFVSGGYRYATRQPEVIQAAAGTYPFEMTIQIPAASCAVGDLLSNTSQLALLMQTSQLKLNIAAASVIAGISTGATITSLAARASAKLVPSSELILGTPIEWILSEPVAGASSAMVQINQFGTNSMLQGIENKGGVLWLGELTNVNNQGGVFAAQTVTGFAFPWRNQQLTSHPQALISDWLSVLPNSRPQVLPTSLTNGDSELASYPYAASTSNQSTTTSTLMTSRGLLAWIMAQPGNKCELTNLQTADADQSYNLQLNTTFSAGSHRVLGAYARRFKRDMRMNWLGQVSKGGSNSLAAHVLGADKWQAAVARAAANDLRQRVPRSRFVTGPDKMTYLPFQLA